MHITGVDFKMRDRLDLKRQPVTGMICLLAAAALLAGQVTNILNIFFTNISAGLAATAAVCLIIFAAVYLCGKLGAKVMTIAAVILAFLLRITFLFIWKIPPEGDFLLTYNLAKHLAELPPSQWSAFLDANETLYNNPWSSHMPFIMYQTFIMKALGTNPLSVQIVNVCLSTLCCVLAAGIAKRLFGERAAFITLFITAINPASLFFIPVLTNQHAATCAFVAALWVFCKKPFGKPLLNILLCSFFTALSQLLRPEMYVVLIAAVCVAVYYGVRKRRLLKCLSAAAVYIALFFVVLTAVNFALMHSGVVHRSIMSGNLKYKLAVGLNTEGRGAWNEADAMLVFDDEKCAEALSERIKNPSIAPLIVEKTSRQFGDFVYTWAMKSETHPRATEAYSRTVSALMLVIGIFAILTLLFDTKRRGQLFPLIIVLSGYIAVFALIEIQSRYNYLLIPLLSILASGMISRLNLTISKN